MQSGIGRGRWESRGGPGCSGGGRRKRGAEKGGL